MEKRKVVIGLGGAFNPIHTQHELTLILAKQFLENELHYEVLCAYFAVATDGYLKNKMAKANQKAITSKHRLAMCELISRESPFIKTTYKPFGSAFECIKTLHAKELHEITICIVVGADRAVSKGGIGKWRKPAKDNILTLCIGRPGETGQVKKLYEQDKRANRVSSSFHFVGQETSPVSSTLIRKELALFHNAQDLSKKGDILKNMVSAGYITKEVAEYILDNQHALYW
eukprot:TRINITY_DN2823_c0_g1_i1.p1 TRINITY_DN2823_c0_g1~~TRINITY_DN2823_c0_g1_i1.p1  ORF type:complete len:243 (-),score=35.79 TRINITY_DN2823_c0_g1_i1:63-752(-)